jgi:amino acid transporter
MEAFSMSDQHVRPALQGNVLTLGHVSAVSLAWLGLAISTYFIIPLAEQATGPITPLVFLVVTLALLPTAVSFAVMTNRRPSAGSAFTWLWESTSPRIGLWIGWLLLTLYALIGCSVQPLFAGITFNSVLSLFNIGTNYWTGVGGSFIFLAVIFWILYRGVHRSTRSILVLLAIEAGFVLVFSLYIIIHQGFSGQLSLAPLNPSAGIGGLDGFKVALLFGVFSLAGFDIVATVSEESKAPRRIVPLATILTTIFAGVFWMFSSYALAVAVPLKTMNAFLGSASQTGVWYQVANQYIGPLKVLVVFTAVTAVVAIMAAIMLAAARLMFAMARDGYFPKWLAEVHPKYKTPWHSQIVIFGIALVIPIAVGLWQGSNLSNAYGWLGEAYVFFIMVPYLFVNVANLVYHLRFRRDQFNILLNGVIPILGIVVVVYLLVVGFFQLLLGLPFYTGSSIVWFSLAWAVVGLVWALIVGGRRRGSATDLYEMSDAVASPAVGGSGGV